MKSPGNKLDSRIPPGKGPSPYRPNCFSSISRATCIVLFVGLAFWPSPVNGAIDTTGSTATHAVFVLNSLAVLRADVIASLALDETVCFRPVDPDSSIWWVDSVFIAGPANASSDTICFRYALTRWAFELTAQKQRRGSGEPWFERRLAVELAVDPPGGSGIGYGRHDVSRQYSGWFPASRLAEFNEGYFELSPPSDKRDFWGRWAAPLGVGVGLGALTYLFFSVR